MKSRKKLIITLLCLIITLSQTIMVYATPADTLKISKQYFSDGSYFETIIVESNAKSTIKNASKTATYKNASGEALWYAKVTANFYFDGSTSSCTSSSASAGTYVDGWKILEKSASRTGNTGSATVRAGIYLNGLYVSSITETVTLSCDKYGNLY